MKILKRLLICVLFIPYGIFWLLYLSIWLILLFPIAYIGWGAEIDDWMDLWITNNETFEDFISDFIKP